MKKSNKRWGILFRETSGKQYPLCGTTDSGAVWLTRNRKDADRKLSVMIRTVDTTRTARVASKAEIERVLIQEEIKP